jgi:myo-inositol-hexaphosphate 3-phosphohydrolase
MRRTAGLVALVALSTTVAAPGATVYPTGKRDGYLIVSSQGDSRFYVYDRRTNRPISGFQVVDGARTDGVQHSDGAAATSTPLPGYPRGLLVLHDGENTRARAGSAAISNTSIGARSVFLHLV